MKTKKIFIDADSIAYRAAAAAENRIWLVYSDADTTDHIASFQYKKEAVKWADDVGIDSPVFKLTKEPESVVNALSNAKNIINKIFWRYIWHVPKLYLSSSENFRDEIATIRPYKGNRKDVEKPYHLESVRSYLFSSYGAEVCLGFEADDKVSLMAYNSTDSVIVSIDKDLNNTPGYHYNWLKEEEYYIDEEEAMFHFYYQMLTGDSVDNVAGVPGIGKQTALKILIQSENLKCDVGLEYAKAYDDPEAAFEENARLLWMARKEINDWSWDL